MKIDELSEGAVVARAPGVSWCDMGDEVVILRVRDQAYYRLQESARALWLGLDQPKSVAVLVAAVRRDFEGEPSEIATDTHAFILHCAQLDLVAIGAPHG